MNTSTAPRPPITGVLGRLMAAASLAIACAVATAQPADLIVTNAKVVTLDAKSTVAQALAVRDGRLLAVGDAAPVGRLAGPATRSVDAGGRTVIPGLMHGSCPSDHGSGLIPEIMERPGAALHQPERPTY